MICRWHKPGGVKPRVKITDLHVREHQIIEMQVVTRGDPHDLAECLHLLDENFGRLAFG
jgi:hypothetical protein